MLQRVVGSVPETFVPQWLKSRLYHEHLRGKLVPRPLISEDQFCSQYSDSPTVNTMASMCQRLELIIDVSAIPEVVVKSEGLDKLVQSFYHTKYKGPAATEFLAHLNKYEQLITVAPMQYYGRSAMIIQSSGTGKSRMVHELGFMGAFSISLCLRRFDIEARNGFPFRDPEVEDFLVQEEQKVVTSDRASLLYASYFEAFFFHATEYLQRYPQVTDKLSAWQELSDPPPKTPVDADHVDGLQKWRRSVRAPFLAAVTQRANDVFQRLINTPDVTTEAATKVAIAEARAAANGLGQLVPDYKFIVAIDEASRLMRGVFGSKHLSADFTAVKMRQVWLLINQPLFWLLMMDTNSSLHHLAPQVEGSGRIQRSELSSVPPFTEFPPHVLAPEAQIAFDTSVVLDMSPLQHADFENLKYFGRPLWSSLTIDQDAHLTLAITKVTGPRPGRDIELVCQQALGLLCQRLEIRLDSRHAKARAKVEAQIHSHLRYIWEYSEDRSQVKTLTLTEPVPSLAAASVLRGIIQPTDEWQVCWTNAIKRLQQLNSDRIGLINVGDGGELVAQIILCMAVDRASNDDIKHKADMNPDTSQMVGQTFKSFRSFMASLVGESALDNIDGRKLLESIGHGYVRFSRIMVAETAPLEITEGCLYEAWLRGVVWQGNLNQPDWDFLIPIYTGHLDVRFDPSKFTVIAVQVENRRTEKPIRYEPLVIRPQRQHQMTKEKHVSKKRKPTAEPPLMTCLLWMELGLEASSLTQQQRVSIATDTHASNTIQVVCRGFGAETYGCLAYVDKGDLRGLLGQYITQPVYGRNYRPDWLNKEIFSRAKPMLSKP